MVELDYDGYAPYNREVNLNQKTFKYGIFNKGDSVDSRWNNEYEDPLFVGFTMEIDQEESSLFKEMLPFIQKYGKYYPEIRFRENIYNLFKDEVLQIFNTRESGNYYKGHYISTVLGLDKLNRKFIENDESFIEVIMNEDCRMLAYNLSYLYNNLVYSYKDLKSLIPYNLQHFNLYIKISEIRNINTIRAELKPEGKYMNFTADKWTAKIKSNMTYIIYKLWNCTFDFSESYNSEDEIRIAGFNASIPDPSTLKFKINFKTVSRIYNPSLIYDDLIFDDNEIDLLYKLHQSININNTTIKKVPHFIKNGYIEVKPMEELQQIPPSDSSRNSLDEYIRIRNQFYNDYLESKSNSENNINI